MEHMSEKAVKSILLAQIHAKYYKSKQLDTEHLLLGIMSDQTPEPNLPMYQNLPTFTIKNVIGEMTREENGNRAAVAAPTHDALILSQDVREVFTLANKEREARGNVFITPELILYTMVGIDCHASKIIRHLKVDVSLLKTTLLKEITDAVPSNDSKQIFPLFKRILTSEPVIGRDREMTRLVNILNRKTKSNAIIVGEAGVGKTALVYGLAHHIKEELYELDTTALIAGTSERGELEKKLYDVIKFFKGNDDRILFIDEIHSLIGGQGPTRGKASASGGSMDDGPTIANILKPPLARGEMRVIGATTHQEYRKYFQNDAAFDRRFQPIYVEEPTLDATLTILKGVKYLYEEFHNVVYTDKALEAAVYLSHRYIPRRKLPDKAIDLIDEAGTIEYFTVTEETIQKIIHQQTNIPMHILQGTATENPDIYHLLTNHILGQDDAMEAISRVVRRTAVDFRDPKRPAASLLFEGPSSCGKTEAAKYLARITNRHLIHLDMSEYMESFSVNSLIGSPPGFAGYDDAGKLTQQVKHHPYSLILFDEIDKADPSIYNLLLQILEDGRLTDAKGVVYDFKNTCIVMTSNKENVFERPELVNRLDDIIRFKPLDRKAILALSNRYLKDLRERVKSLGYDRPITIEDFRNVAKASNAREIKRNIKNLENDIADYILATGSWAT